MKIPNTEPGIFARLSDYDEQERLRYAEVGLMVLTVEQGELWKLRTDPQTDYPCRSLNRWIQIACPYAHSTVYAALRDVKELQDVPTADLAQISQSNMRTMRQLSTKVRNDPKVLEAAKTGRTDALVSLVKANFPQQHLEGEKYLRFTLNETRMADVQEAIRKAMARGCDGSSEVLWMWAIEELSKDDPTPLADVECKGAIQ